MFLIPVIGFDLGVAGLKTRSAVPWVAPTRQTVSLCLLSGARLSDSMSVNSIVVSPRRPLVRVAVPCYGRARK